MKYKVISIGGATRDITFFTEEGILIDNHRDILRQKLLAFEYGAKIQVDHFHNLFGGGATNSAINFARSGFKTACLACVGDDDSGRQIVRHLKDSGIATELMSVDKKNETGLSCILVSQGGERIIFSNRSANSDLKIETREKKILAAADWLYLASLSGDWIKVAKKVFSAKGPKIAWNPGSLQYQAGLKVLAPFLKKTNVLCVNKDEAIELVLSDSTYHGKQPDFLNDVKNLLLILKKTGPEIVVITDGANGADAYDGVNFYHQSIFKEKKRVDMTGVGDAFNSSFVIGLSLTNGDMQKSLYLGARNTASKIAHFGAQNGLIDLRNLI
jgi:sugar/nucleoside kinase (ribokinase family)